MVIVGSSNPQILSGNDSSPNLDCVELILGLKLKPGGHAATKDDALMEPATETRNVISLGPFSWDASRRILVGGGTELGARTLDICFDVTEGGLPLHIAACNVLFDAKCSARYIATLKVRRYEFEVGDRVEEIAAAVRFPHAKLPGTDRNVRAQERGRRV